MLLNILYILHKLREKTCTFTHIWRLGGKWYVIIWKPWIKLSFLKDIVAMHIFIEIFLVDKLGKENPEEK